MMGATIYALATKPLVTSGDRKTEGAAAISAAINPAPADLCYSIQWLTAPPALGPTRAGCAPSAFAEFNRTINSVTVIRRTASFEGGSLGVVAGALQLVHDAVVALPPRKKGVCGLTFRTFGAAALPLGCGVAVAAGREMSAAALGLLRTVG